MSTQVRGRDLYSGQPELPFDGSRLETRRLREELTTLRTGVMCALNMLLDLKDLRTGLHATRLAEWAVRVGELLGLEESDLRDIEAASLLHDIGKIGLPDSILLKPGKLSSEEYAIRKNTQNTAGRSSGPCRASNAPVCWFCTITKDTTARVIPQVWREKTSRWVRASSPWWIHSTPCSPVGPTGPHSQ